MNAKIILKFGAAIFATCILFGSLRYHPIISLMYSLVMVVVATYSCKKALFKDSRDEAALVSWDSYSLAVFINASCFTGLFAISKLIGDTLLNDENITVVLFVALFFSWLSTADLVFDYKLFKIENELEKEQEISFGAIFLLAISFFPKLLN
ncbi:MAG: hypothetical protein LBB75_04870, partial [Oscillospiraceae bacterium]|nr:hypothetical protein [Oscillospiraceae bacterium]